MRQLYDNPKEVDVERYKRYCTLTGTVENIDKMLSEYSAFTKRIEDKLPLNAYPIFSFIFPITIVQIGATQKSVRCSTYSSLTRYKQQQEPDFLATIVDRKLYLERSDGYVIDKAKFLEEFGQTILEETMKLELMELRRIVLLIAPDTMVDEIPVVS